MGLTRLSNKTTWKMRFLKKQKEQVKVLLFFKICPHHGCPVADTWSALINTVSGLGYNNVVHSVDYMYIKS